MLHGSWSGLAHGRVNPVAPLLCGVAGIVLYAAGNHPVGIGIFAGACLAFINGLLLSGRVELAANQGDVGRALLVMQLGFLVTCTVIGIATIIIVHYSVPMAVGTAIGFAVSQLAMVGTFYMSRARRPGQMESKVS